MLWYISSSRNIISDMGGWGYLIALMLKAQRTRHGSASHHRHSLLHHIFQTQPELAPLDLLLGRGLDGQVGRPEQQAIAVGAPGVPLGRRVVPVRVGVQLPDEGDPVVFFVWVF